jgi:poly(beta-D-mannuronate) lyase
MLSDNGNDWMKVLDMVQSSGSSDQLQTFEIEPDGARFVRIVGYGNSSGNGWNSLTEVAIRGH